MKTTGALLKKFLADNEDTWTVSTPVDPDAQGCRSRAAPG